MYVLDYHKQSCVRLEGRNFHIFCLIFNFPAVCAQQSSFAHVSSVQVEPPEDPQLVRKLDRHHGGTQGAQAHHLAQPRFKQHQGIKDHLHYVIYQY